MNLILYKKTDKALLYWETWEDGDKIVVHDGVVGKKGRADWIPNDEVSKQAVEEEVAKLRSKGYAELDDVLSTIVIQYQIDGWGSDEDLEKRYKIHDILDECLGWTGLGRCTGGDIGSDTMNVFCDVVDPYTALEPVMTGLKKHNYLEGAAIAIDREEGFEVLWPKDFKGEFHS